MQPTTLENYFSQFRRNIKGIDLKIETPYHKSIPVVYTDWTASGRIYAPIEQQLSEQFYPAIANTHTDTNYTGSYTTHAYHFAQKIIKKHVNASENDVLITSNSGMTGVINKFQRILGVKIHEKYKNRIEILPEDRPIVFITHMEHHSNQTSWLETICEVVVVTPAEDGTVSAENFEKEFQKHASRKLKIASVTACSNVTGIETPYMDIAEIAHKHQGLCFVDFACSAPYVNINMHENNASGRYLDAILFSPHKFLGGPGSSGVLIFDKKLYNNAVPDHPGGGTVNWTNPWGKHDYICNIEEREDGGTPGFLQTIKTALCIRLKEQMGVENILKREEEQLEILWIGLSSIENVQILASNVKHRLGIFSFIIPGLHHNVGVKILNDRFGIQTRGGCSCAGTYGHHLFGVTQEQSEKIFDKIAKGEMLVKPGWIRLSIHPTNTNAELAYIVQSIKALAQNHETWAKEYDSNLISGEITHKGSNANQAIKRNAEMAFDLGTPPKQAGFLKRLLAQ